MMKLLTGRKHLNLDVIRLKTCMATVSSQSFCFPMMCKGILNLSMVFSLGKMGSLCSLGPCVIPFLFCNEKKSGSLCVYLCMCAVYICSLIKDVLCVPVWQDVQIEALLWLWGLCSPIPSGHIMKWTLCHFISHSWGFIMLGRSLISQYVSWFFIGHLLWNFWNTFIYQRGASLISVLRHTIV